MHAILKVVMDNQIPPTPAPNQVPVQPAAQPVPAPQPVQPVAPPAPATPVVQPAVAPVQEVPSPVATPAPQPTPTPQPAPAPVAEQTQAEAPVTADFSQVQSQQADSTAPAADASITWSAQEYIHPDKTPGWYFLFGFVALALIAVDIFLLQSWTFSALVVVMTIAIIVYIRRPARTLTYALSASQGLYVGEQLHSFDDFKSFGLITADGSNSIMLVPRKRFAPGVSVYFPTEAGEQIVDILGSRLPMEELKLDLVDIVVRKLRL